MGLQEGADGVIPLSHGRLVARKGPAVWTAVRSNFFRKFLYRPIFGQFRGRVFFLRFTLHIFRLFH